MPIKILREKKRIEVDLNDIPTTNVIAVRDHALLKAQQDNPEWSVDADGEIQSWFSPTRKVIVAYIPMLKFEANR